MRIRKSRKINEPLFIFAKLSILDIWQGSEYAFDVIYYFKWSQMFANTFDSFMHNVLAIFQHYAQTYAQIQTSCIKNQSP